mmetsp:Transcript_2007/g.6061  ORF Transcript_2007/g.6061 Transcript_2007/m.6061 type:complete len:351 (+) Transcript_2007:1666-2718(+)
MHPYGAICTCIHITDTLRPAYGGATDLSSSLSSGLLEAGGLANTSTRPTAPRAPKMATNQAGGCYNQCLAQPFVAAEDNTGWAPAPSNSCCTFHACCSPHSQAKTRVIRRIIFAVCLTVTLTFSICAVAVPVWSEASVKANYYNLKLKASISLWRLHIDGKYQDWEDNYTFEDDVALKRRYVLRSATWRAIELNRASTIMALIGAFSVGLYYFISASCFISHITEIILGSVLFAFGVLAFAGSGTWSTEFTKEFESYENYELKMHDETTCDAGCALQAVAGCLYLALGVSMVTVAVGEMCGCLRGADGADRLCASCCCSCCGEQAGAGGCCGECGMPNDAGGVEIPLEDN